MPAKKKLRATTPAYVFGSSKAAQTAYKNGKPRRTGREPSKPLSFDEMKKAAEEIKWTNSQSE